MVINHYICQREGTDGSSDVPLRSWKRFRRPVRKGDDWPVMEEGRHETYRATSPEVPTKES